MRKLKKTRKTNNKLQSYIKIYNLQKIMKKEVWYRNRQKGENKEYQLV